MKFIDVIQGNSSCLDLCLASSIESHDSEVDHGWGRYGNVVPLCLEWSRSTSSSKVLAKPI